VKRWSIVPVAGFDLPSTVAATVLEVAADGGLHALAWLGAALATAALPIQISHGLRRARTSRNLTVMTVIAAVATALAICASLLAGTGWPAAIAIIGMLTTQFYARWHSRPDHSWGPSQSARGL
jgi:hypothetical protein